MTSNNLDTKFNIQDLQIKKITVTAVAVAGAVAVVEGPGYYDLWSTIIGIILLMILQVFVLQSESNPIKETPLSSSEIVVLNAVWALCFLITIGFLLDLTGHLLHPLLGDTAIVVGSNVIAFAIWLLVALKREAITNSQIYKFLVQAFARAKYTPTVSTASPSQATSQPTPTPSTTTAPIRTSPNTPLTQTVTPPINTKPTPSPETIASKPETTIPTVPLTNTTVSDTSSETITPILQETTPSVEAKPSTLSAQPPAPAINTNPTPPSEATAPDTLSEAIKSHTEIKPQTPTQKRRVPRKRNS